MTSAFLIVQLWCALVSPNISWSQTTELTLDESQGGTSINGVANVFTLNESVGIRPSGGLDRFHLFETFEVAAGDTVEWVSPFATRNIFNLVTGGDPSRIDGLLRSDVDADLFLINPNGVMFDENASLDLLGSFTVSSADQIVFENGGSLDLDSADLDEVNALVVSPFERFGFLDSAETIEVHGSRLSLDDDETLGFFASRTVRIEDADDGTPAELNAGRIDLIARRNVRFDNAIVTATAGPLATDSGIVATARQTIHVEAGAVLTTAGPSDSFGILLSAEDISVGGAGTRIDSQAALGNGGAVELIAEDLVSITNGASVRSTATGPGAAASIRIEGTDLLMLDGEITTTSASAAPGQGELDIVIDEVINLMDSRIETSIANGSGGDIRVTAPLLVMQNGSELLADEDRGSIRVEADLVVRSADSRIAGATVELTGVELIHSLQNDLNERLEILPHTFFRNRVQLGQRCAVGSGERTGSLTLERRRAPPNGPDQLQVAHYAFANAPGINLEQTAWDDLLEWWDGLTTPAPSDWLAIAQRAEADGLLDSALEAAHSGSVDASDGSTEAALHAILGRIRARLGEYPEAEKHFEVALWHANQTHSNALLARVRLDQGVALARRRDWPGALWSLERAEELASQASDAEASVSIWANRASILIEAGQLEHARTVLSQGESGRQLNGPREMRAAMHGALASLELADTASDEAPTFRQRGIDRLVEIAAQAERAGHKQVSSFAWGFLAQVYADEGKFTEAIELSQWATEASLAAPSGADLNRWQTQLADLWSETGEFERADRAYGIAINAAGPLGAANHPGLLRRGPFDDDRDRTPVALRQVGVILKRAWAMSDEAERERLYERAREGVEARRVRELTDYFRDPCIAAQQKKSAAAVPRTLVVHPVPLDDGLALIVSVGDRVTAYNVPVAGAELFETLRTTNIQLRDRTTNRYLTGSTQLYEWLIRPIEHEFVDAEIDTLVFVSGPVLRSFPLAALFDQEAGKFLIEKIALASTQGISITEPRPLKKRDLVVLRAGLTTESQGQPPLRFARSELDSLGSLFEGVELIDEAFSRERFEQTLEQGSFDIVHIASHGGFGNSARDAYVLTAKERLDFETLASIIRKTRFRDRPTELITLSACESAVGGEQAVLGLAGLSMRAGARSTLATLWRVNDAATARLMTYFYTHLAQPDESRAGALRKAQRAVLSDPVMHHPSYWAPFTLLGSWL